MQKLVFARSVTEADVNSILKRPQATNNHQERINDIQRLQQQQ